MSSSRVLLLLGVFAITACDGKEGGGDADAGDGAEDVFTETDPDGPDEPEEEPAPCTADGDCTNGLFCDGEETCGEDGLCLPGTAVDCADTDPCTMDACDEETGRCTHGPLDEDGDGYVAEECDGADCDDGAGDIYPEAEETDCDFIDKDCDDDIDETVDDDGDGWVDEDCEGELTVEEAAAAGFEGLGDCDDDSAAVYPGAPEGCDGTVDNDCDGDASEIDTDADGDGYSPPDCDPPEGTADCDDGEESIHPGADEACDLVDQDCNGHILDAPGIDDDGDHVPDEACGGNDCNDESGLVHGAFDPPEGVTDSPVVEEAELCDLLDQDCDGSILDADGADNDGDTVLDHDCGGTDCDDLDGSTYPGAPLSCDTADHDCNGQEDRDNDHDTHLRDACGGDDCDDGSSTVHPGATVMCNPIDRDCNGFPDDDQDGDSHLREACTGGDDCDDGDATAYPGAVEICDDADQDCDGTALDGPGADDDGDTFIDAACPGGDDCDDTTGRFRPGAEPDVCTAADYDCTGTVEPLGPDAPHVIDDGATGSVARIALAWSGSEYGAVMTKAGTRDTFFLRLDAAGNPVPSSGVWITTGGRAGTNLPGIAWGGGRWGLVYDSGIPTGARFVTLASDGSDPQPPGGTALDSPGCSPDLNPDIACSGSEFGIIWTCSDSAMARYRVLFSRAATTGALVGPTIDIADQAGRNDVLNPRIAWRAGLYGVVWTMSVPLDTQVYFDLVDPVSMTDLSEDRLSAAASGNGAYGSSLAGGRVNPGSGVTDGFAVVWYEGPSASSIKSAVFGVSGAKSAPPATLVSSADIQPYVSWNGARFGVALSSVANIRFQQMSDAGSALGPLVTVAETALIEESPVLVWRDGRFGAAWIVDSTPQQAYFAQLFCSGI